MYGENHDNENWPSSEGSDPTAYTSLVEDKADNDRSDDLRYPVYDVIQWTGPDIEYGVIVFVEFCKGL